ncbi:hypothetical protein RB195_017863 [Necator americanus]|uniref:Uncharacterized protein n=1 Tax=Necator americanus TaxID=51031 RepID=A0ABR1C744_NECAM
MPPSQHFRWNWFPFALTKVDVVYGGSFAAYDCDLLHWFLEAVHQPEAQFDMGQYFVSKGFSRPQPLAPRHHSAHATASCIESF